MKYKKIQCLPEKRNTYKFKFIEKFKERYPINIMCKELEISRDAYYKWLKRKDNKNRHEINHESLKPLIQKYYDISNGTAGYRQIKN